MRTVLARTATSAALAALPIIGFATPAHATIPKASIALHVTDIEGVPVRSARLTCNPAGGTHPHADAACAALKHVNGDIGARPHGHTPCPKEYLPVTARASGVWNGKAIRFHEDYSNACELRTATGPVFGF
ncbi:SSI family serine proteinase inhibitor [Nonomuraea sp. NPDC050404]|uniref:SSI family serine proteinase inhibitor n=1 Tax=Nonomuraea sp. NPDC050404 TaxID=3155783 RepID=UPI0033FC7F82